MRARRIAPSILALGLLAAACGDRGDPIRATLDRMVKAAHERDAVALMNLLTPDFQAGDGSGRADTEALVRRSFAAYETLDVRLRDVQIERAENAARVRFRAELSGRPRRIGGLDGLFPVVGVLRFRPAARARRLGVEGRLGELESGGGPLTYFTAQ